MNINAIIEKKASFDSRVIDSGFYRDIQEYIKAIEVPENSQNLALLKEHAQIVLKQLEDYQQTDLPDDLRFLLPGENQIPFTNPENIKALQELLGNSTIDTQAFHNTLRNILNKIREQISSNQNIINNIYKVLQPYYEKQKQVELSEGTAVLSLIFKDPLTISRLKQFKQALGRWDRALPLYHQLVSAESPKEIELVNIQNASLDVLINIKLDVAINLTEIMKHGLLLFGAYLAYKKMLHPIVATFSGNKELIDGQKKQEEHLLENIGKGIRFKLNEQHQTAIKQNTKVSRESIEKKIELVTEAVTDHIVKGNDVKLLTGVTEDEKLKKLKQDRKSFTGS
jgi:hypothetical protein